MISVPSIQLQPAGSAVLVESALPLSPVIPAGSVYAGSALPIVSSFVKLPEYPPLPATVTVYTPAPKGFPPSRLPIPAAPSV